MQTTFLLYTREFAHEVSPPNGFRCSKVWEPPFPPFHLADAAWLPAGECEVMATLVFLPSWIPPNTWSLGRTRLWTVFKSSTQPTLWSSFGTQSRKPKDRMQSILLIFLSQVRFRSDFQEAITHRGFITLSVILASPWKPTTLLRNFHSSLCLLWILD